MGCHFLLQGIVLTQGSNPGLPHCRQTLPSEAPGTLTKAKTFLPLQLSSKPSITHTYTFHSHTHTPKMMRKSVFMLIFKLQRKCYFKNTPRRESRKDIVLIVHCHILCVPSMRLYVRLLISSELQY